MVECIGVGYYGQVEGECYVEEVDIQWIVVIIEFGGQYCIVIVFQNQLECVEEFGG